MCKCNIVCNTDALWHIRVSSVFKVNGGHTSANDNARYIGKSSGEIGDGYVKRVKGIYIKAFYYQPECIIELAPMDINNIQYFIFAESILIYPKRKHA